MASPFLSRPVAEEIATAAQESSAGERRLLTALVPRSVQTGFLDVGGLESLLDAGFELCSVPNLHAKVSLIDETWGLVGSGNLTNSGLGSETRANVELGVTLDEGQIKGAAELFAGWWDDASPIGAAKLAEYAKLPPLKREPGQPGDYGEPIAAGLPRGLQDLLDEDEATASGRGYWVKANYQRHDDKTWWTRGWISDRHQASYELGDMVVLYLSAKYGGPETCPAVGRVTERSEYAPEFLAAEGDADAAEHWPYRTRIEIVGEVTIAQGARLADFGLPPANLRSGHCTITREQFEGALRAMGA